MLLSYKTGYGGLLLRALLFVRQTADYDEAPPVSLIHVQNSKTSIHLRSKILCKSPFQGSHASLFQRVYLHQPG